MDFFFKECIAANGEVLWHKIAQFGFHYNEAGLLEQIKVGKEDWKVVANENVTSRYTLYDASQPMGAYYKLSTNKRHVWEFFDDNEGPNRYALD